MRNGDAKISKGYRLKARYVIHAVGPVYRANDASVPRLLASAYLRSLEVAEEHGVETIAFPAISTGVYGYPLEEAARISLEAVTAFAAAHPRPKLVRFVLFDQRALEGYKNALRLLVKTQRDVMQLD